MTEVQKKRPWFKWYPSDWRGEPSLRMVSRSARSVWLDMLGLMHESTLIGYLLLNGKKPSPEQLARVLGDDIRDLVPWLEELAAAGVYSETEDGIIYSRRMVRDHERAEKGREDVGRRGGAWGKPEKKTQRDPDRLVTRDPNRVSTTLLPSSTAKPSSTVGPGAEESPEPTAKGYPEDFEKFWVAYPRSPNMSKAEAGKSWAKLKAGGLLPDGAAMSRAVASYRKFLADQSKGRKDPHPAAHAATWLNQRRFEGFLEAPAQAYAGGDPGPGWEAAYPDTWARLRKFYADTHRSDLLWQNTFAGVRPNGSAFTIICRSLFERDHLTDKYGENLKRLFGHEVTFIFDPAGARAPAAPSVIAASDAGQFPTPEGHT
jgi:hypothetical protein